MRPVQGYGYFKGDVGDVPDEVAARMVESGAVILHQGEDPVSLPEGMPARKSSSTSTSLAAARPTGRTIWKAAEPPDNPKPYIRPTGAAGPGVFCKIRGRTAGICAFAALVLPRVL